MKKGRVRQDPVSCELCRSKKLKCNREQPCSNCTARGVSCKFHTPPPPGRVAAAPASQKDAQILERIQRLEAVVLQSSPSESHFSHASDESRPVKRIALSPVVEHVVANEVHRDRDQDTETLDQIATREDSLVCFTAPILR